MGVALWIFLGLGAGAAARFVMPGPLAGGKPVGIALGVVGALAGGIFGAVLAGGMTTAVDARSLLMAICGALFVLLAYRAWAMRGFEALP